MLRNDTQSGNHWIRFILEGTKSNRDAIGAKLAITAGGKTIYRQRKGGYSMESSNDSRVLVGIGRATTVEKAVIRWPTGRELTLEKLKADHDYKVVEPKTDAAIKPMPTAAKAATVPDAKAKPAK